MRRIFKGSPFILTVIRMMFFFILTFGSEAFAAGEGILSISSLPSGADVYIDEVFVDQVTPCEIPISPGTHKVELKIKGYDDYVNESVVITEGAVTALDNIKQLPTLIDVDPEHTITVTTLADKVRWNDVYQMSRITVADLKADTETPISLREAIEAIKNEPLSKGHYRIEFADSVLINGKGIIKVYDSHSEYPRANGLNENIYIEKRGNLTINGDVDRDGVADITLDIATHGVPNSPKGVILNTYASNVYLAGLIFDAGEHLSSLSTLQMRVPDTSTEKYDIENVHVLGCTFINSFEIGVGTCGAYGYGAKNYGGAGTTNFKNLVFAGNTFNKTQLFSFAGAGDEDYNIIDGYYIAANDFIDRGIGMLASDAHTWYVYGAQSQFGNGGTSGDIGFCNYNKIMNVYINGNKITINEDNYWASIIGISTANMGNTNSIVENVYIRNNKSLVTGINSFSSVAIENVNGGACESYSKAEFPNLNHNTQDNTMRNVHLKNNDFQIGDTRCFCISNLGVGFVEKSGMDATGNIMEDIFIECNSIEARSGVKISGIHMDGQIENDDFSNNIMRSITFKNNQVTRTRTDGYEHTGLMITNYSCVRNNFFPTNFKNNIVTDIDISGNKVSNYQTGIVVSGSTGDSINAHSVKNVTLNGNNIHCTGDGRYGISITGATMGGCSPEVDAYHGSTNCSAENIIITNNIITAPGGVIVAGDYYIISRNTSVTGNAVRKVNISGNTITQPDTIDVYRPLPPIIVAGIVDEWGRLDQTKAAIAENLVKDITIRQNILNFNSISMLDLSSVPSEYELGSEISAQSILESLKAVTDYACGLDSFTWEWKDTVFSTNATGSFMAKGIRNSIAGVDVLYYGLGVMDNYDLNNDGKIDLHDLAFLSVHYGKSEVNLIYDLNKDGIIDIYDLVILSTTMVLN